MCEDLLLKSITELQTVFEKAPAVLESLLDRFAGKTASVIASRKFDEAN
jgi:hypothetical protein